jgi:aspartate/methionine/tyrosine aminotransferase
MNNKDWENLIENRKGILEVAPELYERSIYIRTCGKDIQGTGLRIGFCFAGNKDVASGLAGFHFNMCHTPPEFTQPLIAIALNRVSEIENKIELAKIYLPRLAILSKKLSEDNLLVGGDDVVGGMFAVAELSNIKGTKISNELNNFIAQYIDEKFCGEKITNSLQIACKLMFENKIAVVPGEGFGLTPDMVRVSSTQANIEDTKVIADRILGASRKAAVEHILDAMAVKTGVQAQDKGTAFLIPKSNINENCTDGLKNLKGINLDDSGERNIKIDFKNQSFAKLFGEQIKIYLERSKK